MQRQPQVSDALNCLVVSSLCIDGLRVAWDYGPRPKNIQIRVILSISWVGEGGRIQGVFFWAQVQSMRKWNGPNMPQLSCQIIPNIQPQYSQFKRTNLRNQLSSLKVMSITGYFGPRPQCRPIGSCFTLYLESMGSNFPFRSEAPNSMGLGSEWKMYINAFHETWRAWQREENLIILFAYSYEANHIWQLILTTSGYTLTNVKLMMLMK